MKKLIYVYSPKQTAQIDFCRSPSALKPQWLHEAVQKTDLPVQVIEPIALTLEDFYLAHDKDFVDGILLQKIPNGFGDTSIDVIRSLPYTSGAMYVGALQALSDGIAAAFVSGFHHAGYSRCWGYCTFNGLIITAQKLLKENGLKKIAIIDADYHYGDGTANIIERLNLAKQIYHYSFGKSFRDPRCAQEYLTQMALMSEVLQNENPDIILYQAGADAHVDDPLGGLLSTDELYQRDLMMFTIARDLKIPIVWNLAGGYQRDSDGGISKVLGIHLNTVRACFEI